MKHRINSAVVNAAFVLSVFFAPVTYAQSAPGSTLRSPIHLEAAVVNAEALAIGSSVATPRRSASPPRPRARPQKTPPTAPALRLETKEAARQVLRDDLASRQQLTRMHWGGVDRSDRKVAPHVMQNLRETAAPPMIEMGDHPARSQSLCGDGKYRKFAELDSKTVAALLPEFNALRPRTVCARRGVLIADYAFK